jgi:hypothetical protein
MKLSQKKFLTDNEFEIFINQSIAKRLNNLSKKEEAIFARWAKKHPIPKIEFNHSDDFRNIIFHDIPFTLTLKQSLVLEYLYNSRKNGMKEVSKATLLEAAEIKSDRLKNIFTGENRLLLKTLIVPGLKKSTYRLKLSIHHK